MLRCAALCCAVLCTHTRAQGSPRRAGWHWECDEHSLFCGLCVFVRGSVRVHVCVCMCGLCKSVFEKGCFSPVFHRVRVCGGAAREVALTTISMPRK